MPVLVGQGSVWRRAQTVIWGDRGRILLQIHSNTRTQQIHIRHHRSLCLSFSAIRWTNQKTYCNVLRDSISKCNTFFQTLISWLGWKFGWVVGQQISNSLHHTTTTCNSSQQQMTQHVKCKWVAKLWQMMLKSFSELFQISYGPLQTSKPGCQIHLIFLVCQGTLTCYNMIQRTSVFKWMFSQFIKWLVMYKPLRNTGRGILIKTSSVKKPHKVTHITSLPCPISRLFYTGDKKKKTSSLFLLMRSSSTFWKPSVSLKYNRCVSLQRATLQTDRVLFTKMKIIQLTVGQWGAQQ